MLVIYFLIQWTWGILQSVLGMIVFLMHVRDRHFWYHGALVTVWKSNSSVSLGMFVFVTEKPYFYEKLKGDYKMTELFDRLLVHEYGHTVQSMILGPLYLIIMGIPSTLWGFLPALNKKRKVQQISYFSFFTERWANCLGERITGCVSMEQLVID